MKDARILIVDDEPDMVTNCRRILEHAGYQCLTADDGSRGLELVEAEHPDVLLTDLRMPGLDGMELMRRAQALDPELPVIVITGFASIESAVAAVKEGAFDYLPKTFSMQQLQVAVDRALRHPGSPSRTGTCGASSRRRWGWRTSSGGARRWPASSSSLRRRPGRRPTS